jgi:hypothetical protein
VSWLSVETRGPYTGCMHLLVASLSFSDSCQELWRCLSFAVMATLGPACREVEVLCKMLEEGMSCARVDLTVWPSIYLPFLCVLQYLLQMLRQGPATTQL